MDTPPHTRICKTPEAPMKNLDNVRPLNKFVAVDIVKFFNEDFSDEKADKNTNG
jgi:hypothetical protein